MAIGIALFIAGIGALVAGGRLTKAHIERAWGVANRETQALSEGNGIVPSWISMVVLGGWGALAAGAISFLV